LEALPLFEERPLSEEGLPPELEQPDLFRRILRSLVWEERQAAFPSEKPIKNFKRHLTFQIKILLVN
jgi:hypothetical protein